MLPDDLDKLTEEHLAALIDEARAEDDHIDYKAELPDSRDPAKKADFLKDISSFANFEGGHIIYGMLESNGIATRLAGQQYDPDAESIRLNSMALAGIRPRIPSLRFKPVELSDGSKVMVLRIERSWAGPHMIADSHKFYRRRGNMQLPMDYDEIRSAFLSAEHLGERITKWRNDRFQKIMAESSHETGVYVLHIMPLESFGGRVRLDIKSITDLYGEGYVFEPLVFESSSAPINFDGFLSSAATTTQRTSCQVFRTGQIELRFEGITGESGGIPCIRIARIEANIVKSLPRYFEGLKRLGINAPISIAGFVAGVRKRYLKGNSGPGSPIESDHLFLPDVLIDDYEFDPSKVLAPLFNSVWNAGGHLQSNCYYGDSGEWNGKQYLLEDDR